MYWILVSYKGSKISKTREFYRNMNTKTLLLYFLFILVFLQMKNNPSSKSWFPSGLLKAYLKVKISLLQTSSKENDILMKQVILKKITYPHILWCFLNIWNGAYKPLYRWDVIYRLRQKKKHCLCWSMYFSK